VNDLANPLAHHFDDLDQQRDAAELGMWVFLATEVLFFGGLFLAYAVYRGQYGEAFAAASHHLDSWLGAANTLVLLTSSLTMALAVHAAQTGRRGLLVGLLLATLLLGAVFLGVKLYEYHHKYEEQLVPLFGLPFHYESPARSQAMMFFTLYFIMTGVHALHMVIGIGVLGTLVVLAWRGGLLAERYIPVHLSGLYWHFVDIVWVFLFPFLYLVGTR
jgi:cytochrome c oxidase subunit 3